MPLATGLVLWCGLIGTIAVPNVLVDSESWVHSLTRAGSILLLWAFFLPGVVWLSLQFPLGWPNVRLQLLVHLGACALIVLANQVVYRTVIAIPPEPLEKGMNLPESQVPLRKPSWVGMRMAPDSLIYLITMSVSSAFANVRKSQDRERRAVELEARLSQAKLQGLRMQINPHFLFNTLNAISTLVYTSPRTADEMITDLSELLRVSLKSSDDQEIPLSRELELLEHYLTIEQRRFGPRLRITRSVAPDLLDALVPTLIFQPIVENAVRHGVESRMGIGEVVVCASSNGDALKLLVSDNGKKPIVPSQRTDQLNGVGLNNTRARLRLLYGDRQSLSIGKGELGGWSVEITMPLRRRTDVLL